MSSDKLWQTLPEHTRQYMQVVAGCEFPKAWKLWTTYVEERGHKRRIKPRFPGMSADKLCAYLVEASKRWTPPHD